MHTKHISTIAKAKKADTTKRKRKLLPAERWPRKSDHTPAALQQWDPPGGLGEVVVVVVVRFTKHLHLSPPGRGMGPPNRGGGEGEGVIPEPLPRGGGG